MPEVEQGITMSLRDSPYLPPKINTNFMHNCDPNLSPTTDDDLNNSLSNFSAYDSNRLSGESSPILMSPWTHTTPFPPWFNKGMDNSNHHKNATQQATEFDGLVGSLYREEGHIYSLACSGDLLYTGSGSKNIRVWRNLNEFTAFKSNSGLVKAIVLSGDQVFTGHQDGKIRIWKKTTKDPPNHKRVGTFPTRFDVLISSIKPNNYVQVTRKCTSLWIKHCDAISCLSIDEHEGLLYSCSWDQTFKVWNTSNSKCLESVKAHDDAVNAIVGAGSGLVLTGSADGCVKVWRRKWDGKVMKHSYVETLLDQECAVTALAVAGLFVYCGLSDGLVKFWVRENERILKGGALKGHKVAVLCLTAAGKFVFSGSADKTICVWKREGQGQGNNVHSCLSVLTGHEGPVKCLAVERGDSGEGRWVVYSGSLDKSVKVWSVSE